MPLVLCNVVVSAGRLLCVFTVMLLFLQGDYSGNAVAKDQKGQELFCINFNINF